MKLFAYAIAFGLLGLALHQSLKKAIEFANDVHQMSEDISAIRKTLAPFPISDVPADRDNAEWRGEVKQEVSLL